MTFWSCRRGALCISRARVSESRRSPCLYRIWCKTWRFVLKLRNCISHRPCGTSWYTEAGLEIASLAMSEGFAANCEIACRVAGAGLRGTEAWSGACVFKCRVSRNCWCFEVAKMYFAWQAWDFVAVRTRVCSVECAAWSVKCGVRSVKCGMWSVKCELWRVECDREVEVECRVWSVERGVESVQCGVGSVRREVWRVWRVEWVEWSVTWRVWSVKCDVGSGKCGVESVKCEVWSVECEVWSMECDVGSEEYGVSSVEWRVESVKCGVRSVECEVWGGERGVWSGECEMWSVESRVWSVEFGVESVKCEVRSVKCEVWCGEREVQSGDCEVWSVKGGVESVNCEVRSVEWRVWSVKCGVESVKCEVNQVLHGSSPNSLHAIMLGFLFSCREPKFCVASKRNWSGGFALPQICHLLAPLLSSPFFLCGCLGRPLRTGYLGVDVSGPKIAPNVFLRLLFFSICVVPTGLGTSHQPHNWEVCLTICVSHRCTVYFAFLLVASLGRRFSRLSYPTLHSRDCPGPVFFPTGLPTWLSICLPSCGGFATGEFLHETLRLPPQSLPPQSGDPY